MTDTNPITGTPDPNSPSVVAGTTESDIPSDAPEAPSAPRDINPDVVAHSAPSEAADDDTAVPEPPSLLDRIRALEVKVFGSQHPADPGDDDTDDN